MRDAVEENRKVLKEKIGEAKTVGERANQSRNTITYLKSSIEAIRRERALQRLDKGSEEKGDSDEEESEDEGKYRRAIEQEKTIYKESFERLRVLKPEIEHVRKIMEKSRAAMQNQFDEWYNNLHARGLDAFDYALATQVTDASSTFDPRRSIEKAEAKETGGSSVDEDILAFQQAKDELLKRRSNR